MHQCREACWGGVVLEGTVLLAHWCMQVSFEANVWNKRNGACMCCRQLPLTCQAAPLRRPCTIGGITLAKWSGRADGPGRRMSN